MRGVVICVSDNVRTSDRRTMARRMTSHMERAGWRGQQEKHTAQYVRGVPYGTQLNTFAVYWYHTVGTQLTTFAVSTIRYTSHYVRGVPYSRYTPH
jgi:hypothetical protein